MKFIIDNIFLIGLALLSGGALLWPSLRQRGGTVSVLQATQLINQGKSIVVDVREPKEFAEGHIHAAKNIPLKELPNKLGELEKFKSKTLIVVCQNGAAASKAIGQLKKAGFAEIVGVKGGLTTWLAQGQLLVK